MMRRASTIRPAARGSVVLIVLWTIAIATLSVAATQMLSYRQATLGHEAVERVQSRWAARAGIEYTIAVMANHTRFPVPEDAFAMVRDMEVVSKGGVINATWSIEHTIEGSMRPWGGPLDEHARLNANIASSSQLMLMEDMTFDVADAIRDWIDQDDDPGALGVEREYYETLDPSYSPRNGHIRSIGEIELIAGVFPEYFRGEDWNLNGRLDPSEDDGHLTLPLDQPDGLLDAGWSAYLTAYSTDVAPSGSGEPRIYLRAAEPEDLTARLGVSDAQARSLIYFGRNESNTLDQLATIDLSRVDSSGNAGDRVVNPAAEALTEEELQVIQDELSITDPLDRLPGKMNINSVSPKFLRDLMTAIGADEFVADEIIYLRESGPEGIVSLADLEDLPELDGRTRQSLAQLFGTTSSIYSISSQGRSDASGLEVEIIAVVDRSTVPIKIIEYREQ
jgi:hypothetical protein